MNYNPYDLVPLLINGKPMQGRPFEMDSDVVNQKKMTNGFGNLVKPSKVMTMCPDCSQGLQVELKLGEPPFEPVVYSCPYCKPAPPPVVDPFVNPVKTGRVPAASLDPILHNPDKPLSAVEEKGETVADRFKVPEEPAVASPVPSAAPEASKPAPRPPRPQGSKKDKKKGKKNRGPEVPITHVPAQPTQAAPPPVEAPKPRPAMTQQVVPPRPVEDVQGQDDPFTLTRTAQTRQVNVEKADGLGEEQDFDDKDMVE